MFVRFDALMIVTTVAIATCVSGCGRAEFHSNGTRFPPKMEDCPLRILGAFPGPGWVEIGTISIQAPRDYDPEMFVYRVRDELCEAGADAVVTEVNGSGKIARGVVLKFVGGAQTPAPAAAQPMPSVSACNPICSPGFDCVQGTCVPLCNPACTAGEACGRDRLCHPLDAGTQGATPH